MTPLTALLILGCGSSSPATSDTTPQALTILAAGSLTGAYTDISVAFEASHPDIEVTLSFAGSQALATQIRHGIGADVFASANAAHIDALAEEGLVGPSRPFASNAIVLAVPADRPGPADLEHLPDVESLVVGTPEVPVGHYTEQLLDAAQARYGDAWRAQVESRIVSREPSVRLVAAKLAMGETDAAMVYATDVVDVAGLEAVALPSDLAPAVTYHHALVTDTPSAELAEAWMAFVEGPRGQDALQGRGFTVASSRP